MEMLKRRGMERAASDLKKGRVGTDSRRYSTHGEEGERVSSECRREGVRDIGATTHIGIG